MKAIRIHGYGHSDRLKLEDVQPPQIKEGHVLVRVRDAGVNPFDWKLREGYMKDGIALSFPYILGQDFAEEVLESEPGVTEFKKGDRVNGFGRGAYAELVLVEESSIARIPDRVNFATAASIPTAGLAAYQAVNRVNPKKDDVILIHGAAGGVGMFAVQLALWKGLRVIATAFEEDIEYLKGLGLQNVIANDKERFEDRVGDVDIVLDLIGGEILQRSFDIVKKDGVVISTVGPIDKKLADRKGVRAIQFYVKRNSEDLFEMAKLVESGVLKVKVERIYPLAEAATAQDSLQKGHTQGKIVLEI